MGKKSTTRKNGLTRLDDLEDTCEALKDNLVMDRLISYNNLPWWKRMFARI
jgi:hypothetical protein